VYEKVAITSDWRFEIEIRRKVEQRLALANDTAALKQFDSTFYHLVQAYQTRQGRALSDSALLWYILYLFHSTLAMPHIMCNIFAYVGRDVTLTNFMLKKLVLQEFRANH
jgi:hypothetical protein